MIYTYTSTLISFGFRNLTLVNLFLPEAKWQRGFLVLKAPIFRANTVLENFGFEKIL